MKRSYTDQTSIRGGRRLSHDDMRAEYEVRARQYYDRLVDMGARPTRPLRMQHPWTATYNDGLFHIFDSKGDLECSLSGGKDLMFHCWYEESWYYKRELENWQKFREYQQDVQHLDRLETELDLKNTDAGLIKALTHLSDWQEFEVFQHGILANALDFEDQCRQDFLYIMERDVATGPRPANSVAHNAIGPWLQRLNQSQEEVEAGKKQLNWINDQWPKAVAETIETLSMAPELQSALEAKFRKQTHGTFSAIQKLGGRPSHAVRPPDGAMDVLRRLLYWSSESAKYMEELLDWKMFLYWRRHQLGELHTAQEGEHCCPEVQSAEFKNFRIHQHGLALSWLKCWKRVARWYEEENKTSQWYGEESDGPCRNFTPGFLDDYAEAARSHVTEAEQKVAEAAARLETSRQEHAHALSEHDQSVGCESAIQCPQKPLNPRSPASNSNAPPSASFSSSHFSSQSTSSQFSHSSWSPRSPQTPRRLSKDRRLSIEDTFAEKQRRRSKKMNAREKQTNTSNINTEQQGLPPFWSNLHDIEDNYDSQMADAPHDVTSVEATKQSWRAKLENSNMTNSQDYNDHFVHVHSYPSQPPTTPVSISKPRKSPSPAPGPPPKQTRCTVKLDQAPTNRVLKNKNKQSAKKPKAFTKQQIMILLNAASYNDPDTNISPLRRSERLKEKAAVSAAIETAPQPSVAQPSESLQQEQLHKELSPVQPSKPSRQKRPRIADDTIEPLPESEQPRQKKRRI